MSLVPTMPAPMPKWYKWLIQAAQYAVVGAELLYDQISHADTVEEVQWRYIAGVWQRSTPVGTQEDYAQIGLNVVNITGGNIDSSWTAGDYTTCEAHLDELYAKLTSYIASTHTFLGWRWYVRSFNPTLPIGDPVGALDPNTGKPYNRFARGGPPVHLTVKNIPGGSAATPHAYQTALSVTFRTPGPKHWGRIYLPGMTSGDINAQHGRFSSSVTVGMANAWAEFLDDMQGSEFQICVPATQHDGKFATALNGVTEVVVDDIPDVIRRRRPKQASLRSVGVPTP